MTNVPPSARAVSRRRAWNLAPLLFLATWLHGCANYSTQDAYAACQTLGETRNLTEAEFADCVACYESCGESCGETADSGDHAFTCP